MGDVKRIAILGGGVGAMTAAFWLTEKSDPAATQYDITVYQLGWRLGGKGASGRNMRAGDYNVKPLMAFERSSPARC
jgi:uncharacterized protein with NAD-binding domain and iron-sulfur cluster